LYVKCCVGRFTARQMVGGIEQWKLKESCD
jgi:hypothetical protein